MSFQPNASHTPTIVLKDGTILTATGVAVHGAVIPWSEIFYFTEYPQWAKHRKEDAEKHYKSNPRFVDKPPWMEEIKP